MGGGKSIPAFLLAAATLIAADEEGSIVTHNWSITLGKHKMKAKEGCILALFHQCASLCLNSCSF